jgi:hypothetical protein
LLFSFTDLAVGGQDLKTHTMAHLNGVKEAREPENKVEIFFLNN